MFFPPRARSLASSWLVVTCASWLAPQWARAECATPAPQVLWSYPAAGQNDVPTNATLWLRLSRLGNIALTLNGTEQPYVAVDALSADEPGRMLQIGPTALEPNTEYVLRVRYEEGGDAGSGDGGALDRDAGWSPDERPLREDAGSPAPAGTMLEVAFRTGATALEGGALASPQIESTSVDLMGVDERVAQHPCRSLIEAQGCFEVGSRKSLTLTVQADQALAFLLLGPGLEDAQLWPARCGSPLLYMRREITDIFGVIGLSPQCYEVRAVQPGGLLTDSVSFCTDASEPGLADAGAPPVDGGVDAGVVAMDASSSDASTADVRAAEAAVGEASVPTTNKRDDDGCTLIGRDTNERSRAASAALLLGLALLLRRATRRQHS